MGGIRQKLVGREKRRRRVRRGVFGIAERPRLNVFRSLKHIHAQIIDDTHGHTLAAASTLDGEVRAQAAGKAKTDQAEIVGTVLGERALAAGINQVVFDRGGYRYHGRVKALADAVRKAGVDF